MTLVCLLACLLCGAQQEPTTPAAEPGKPAVEPAPAAAPAAAAGVALPAAEKAAPAAAAAEPVALPQDGIVTAGTLVVRARPGAHYERIGQFSGGSRVTIVGGNADWYEVRVPADTRAWIAAQYLDREGTVTANQVRLHSGPGLVFTTFCSAKKGTKLVLLGPPVDGWQQVHAPADASAWISRAYVRTVDPEPPAATAAAPTKAEAQATIMEPKVETPAEPNPETVAAAPAEPKVEIPVEPKAETPTETRAETVAATPPTPEAEAPVPAETIPAVVPAEPTAEVPLAPTVEDAPAEPPTPTVAIAPPPEAPATAPVPSPVPAIAPAPETAPIPTAPAPDAPIVMKEGVLLSLKSQASELATHVLCMRVGTTAYPICYLKSARLDLTEWENREVRVYGRELRLPGWSLAVMHVHSIQVDLKQ